MRLLLLAVLVVLAPSAQAQFFSVVDDLFQNVNAIVFYGQAGALISEDEIFGTGPEGSLYGGGAEVLINLPGTDNTYFELALGTNVVQGLRATEPSLDLRGSLRSLPTIAVYASKLGLPESSAVIPYIGANFGVLSLWNARGYLPDGTVIPLEGETFELGASLGAYANRGPLTGLYVELNYRHREFESVTWGAEQVPTGWPRSINASSAFVSVGWQFFITRKSDGDDATE